MRKALAFLCLALFVLLAPAVTSGQAVYGNIVGTMTDPSGAAVPNVKVTITDTARSITYSATTNDDGNYSVRRLIAGTYEVRVEAAGFKAAKLTVLVSVD